MILWVFTKLLVVIKSLCCAINSHSAVCQLYLSKTGRKKKEKGMTLMAESSSRINKQNHKGCYWADH